MKIKKLNDEAWSITEGNHTRIESGKKYIAKLEKMKRNLYAIFGDDDSLMDELNGAIARIEELVELPDDQIKN